MAVVTIITTTIMVTTNATIVQHRGLHHRHDSPLVMVSTLVTAMELVTAIVVPRASAAAADFQSPSAFSPWLAANVHEDRRPFLPRRPPGERAGSLRSVNDLQHGSA